MNCGVTREATFDLYSMRAILSPHEDVWSLNIAVHGVPRLCSCPCLHTLRPTVDWSLRPASCLCLTVSSCKLWSVRSGRCDCSANPLIHYPTYSFALLLTVLSSFPLVTQAVAHDLINRRVKAVTGGHSCWCVHVCVVCLKSYTRVMLATRISVGINAQMWHEGVCCQRGVVVEQTASWDVTHTQNQQISYLTNQNFLGRGQKSESV